jgi:hypothetical protein
MDDTMHDPLRAKAQVLRDLHTIVVTRLFGNGPCSLIQKPGVEFRASFAKWASTKLFLNDGRTKRATAFGKEQHLHLQMVFMGLWEPWDALWVLLDHGLIDADERDTLEDCLCTGSDPELLLRDRVRRAYYEYYCPRGYRH